MVNDYAGTALMDIGLAMTQENYGERHEAFKNASYAHSIVREWRKSLPKNPEKKFAPPRGGSVRECLAYAALYIGYASLDGRVDIARDIRIAEGFLREAKGLLLK